ncbi:MAG TPA: hypothetical protein VF584_22495 [Longimicrobium sp.]|jgi:type II secretory pathway pseudopilin PulG
MAEDQQERHEQLRAAARLALQRIEQARQNQESGQAVSEPNPAFQAILGALAKNIRDRYYKGQTLYLDGYTFTNCCFHNCTLVTETGLFSVYSCTFANSTVQFGASARRIIRLFTLYHKSPWESFNPEIAEDGSITIE